MRYNSTMDKEANQSGFYTEDKFRYEGVEDEDFLSFLQHVDDLIAPYPPDMIPEKQIFSTLVKESCDRELTEKELKGQIAHFSRMVFPLKVEGLYKRYTIKNVKYTDRESLLSGASVWYQRARYLGDDGKYHAATHECINGAAQLWRNNERAEGFRRAAASAAEKEQSRSTKPMPLDDQDLDFSKSSTEKEKIELVSTFTKGLIEEKIRDLDEFLALNSFSARVDTIAWGRHGLDERIWEVLNFIVHADRKDLAIMIEDIDRQPSTLEVLKAFKLTHKYLCKYPELFTNLGELYTGVKFVVDKDPTKYY